MRRRARQGPTVRRALLIIDMINALDGDDGIAMLRQALPVARNIARLKRRLQGHWPMIYVNDNFMHWQADFNDIVAACAAPGSRGAALVSLLRPAAGDYFILKPKHSGFFRTPLEVLLAKLRVSDLVLAGIEADGCVLATAADGHLREFGLHVPADCVAAPTRARTRRALAVMKDAFGVEIGGSRTLR